MFLQEFCFPVYGLKIGLKSAVYNVLSLLDLLRVHLFVINNLNTDSIRIVFSAITSNTTLCLNSVVGNSFVRVWKDYIQKHKQPPKLQRKLYQFIFCFRTTL